jgi:hypothetical protein
VFPGCITVTGLKEAGCWFEPGIREFDVVSDTPKWGSCLYVVFVLYERSVVLLQHNAIVLIFSRAEYFGRPQFDMACFTMIVHASLFACSRTTTSGSQVSVHPILLCPAPIISHLTYLPPLCLAALSLAVSVTSSPSPALSR